MKTFFEDSRQGLLIDFKTGFRLMAALVVIGMISGAHAQSTIVTVAEDPFRVNSSLGNTDVFTFDTLSRGVQRNVSWSGVGSFDQLNIKSASVWGGAPTLSQPGGSQYSVQGVGSIKQTTLTLDTSSSYFGMYWSAGDSRNRLSFYSGNELVSQFTTSTLMSNLPGEYYGNPIDKNLVTHEPYAFINFYGDEESSWDRIVFDNDGRSGFEADNLTSRVFSYDPVLDAEADFGTVVAEIVGDTTTEIEEVPVDWSPNLSGSVPAAPTPAFYAVLSFLLMFVFRSQALAFLKV